MSTSTTASNESETSAPAPAAVLAIDGKDYTVNALGPAEWEATVEEAKTSYLTAAVTQAAKLAPAIRDTVIDAALTHSLAMDRRSPDWVAYMRTRAGIVQMISLALSPAISPAAVARWFADKPAEFSTAVDAVLRACGFQDKPAPSSTTAPAA